MTRRAGLPLSTRRREAPAPIVALEKRIAFDGAAAVTVAKAMRPMIDAAHTDAAHADAQTGSHLAVADAHRGPTFDTHAAARLIGSTTQDAAIRVGAQNDAVSASKSASGSSAVVFIESDVPDIKTLIADIDHSAQIVILDSTKDGVDAIASYLAAHKGVKDVYIFSHGSEAQLDLGSATLDATSMQGHYASDLATIKSSLAPGANILVYGCDFAEGAAGDGAAHLLAELTGASVAASTNLTGGTAEGGDFVLEDHVGTIMAPDVLSARIASDYDGLLASPTTVFATSGTGAYKANVEFLTFANTTLATGGITNGATATYTTAEGSTVTVTFSNVSNATDAATFKPAALNAYSPAKFYGGYNNASSSSIMLYGGYKDTASFTVSFSAVDKNGKSYTPNIAFADGEVTEATGEYYKVTTTGGNFSNVETIGSTSYSLTGTGTQTIQLSNTSGGVPLLVTDNASRLNVTVEIAGGKEGFVLALVNPTLSLDKDASSGATANNYQTTFTEKGSAVAIADTDTNAVEPGLTNATSATIVLTNAQAGDALSVGTLPSGITSSIDTSKAGQVTVTLSGASSLANYDSAIHAISFSNASSNPSTVDRNINVTFSDGSQSSNTAVSTVHVTAVNDAPVETVPGAQTTNKDTSLSISGLSVSDVDANGGAETVTLSVADGTISLASTTGLTFSKGTGTNDTTETFTGTLSAINNAIATIKYQPTTGYYGSDTLRFSTNDNGNTGSGGAMTASQTVGITVNNVNPTPNGTIANQKYTDGQSGISIATSQAFSDSLGLTLTYSATGLPTGLSIDATTGKITGTVDHDASTNAPVKTGSGASLDGTYTVVETASDGQGGSTTQTFKIDATNQAPIVGTKTANQTNKDGDTISPVNAAAAFSDPNGDPLTYTASNLPAGLSISSAGVITGTVSKTAATGPYTVTVTATDDKGASTPETFTWQINDVLPTAGADTFSAAHNGSVAINVLGNDTDALGRQLTVTQVNGTAITAGGAAVAVANGSVKLNSNGTLTFTPTTGYVGSPSFTYTIADPVGGTTTANVTGVVTDARPIVDLNGPQTVTNTITNGTSLGSTGWSTTNGTQSMGGYYFDTDYGTGSISQANVTGLDHGAGAYGAAQLSFGFGWNNGSPDVKSTTVNVTVGGVVYAQITTGTPGSDPNIATITYLNGASGNVSAVTATAYKNWTPTQVTLDLPANVVSKGTVAFNVDSSASTDDVFFNNVSTTTLPATTYGYATTYIEKGSAVAIAASSASVFDGDDANLASASVVLTNKLAGDQLAIAGTAVTNGSSGTYMGLAYTVSDASGTETISFTGSATKAVYQKALEAVTFANTNYAPSTTQRTLNVTVSDGISTSATAVTTINVVDQAPSANGALANEVYTDGQSPITIATAGGFNDPSGSAFTYTVSGLPKGLTIDPATGTITGTIDHDASINAPKTTGSGATLDGTYTVSVTATDMAGRAVTQSFTIDSTNQAPVVGTNTANQTNKDGETITPVDASKAFSDPNGDTLTYAASNLPKGLTINPTSGLISGTIAANAAPGTYAVRVTATDDKGAATREVLTWTVQDVPPTTNGTLPNQTFADATSGISIATAGGFNNPNGLSLTYSASGLPKGLSIDPSTGLVTGQLDHDASNNAPKTSGSGATLDGTYSVIITASDGQGGTAQQTFAIDATNNAPTLAAQTPDQSGANGQTVSLDASKAFFDKNTGDTFTYGATGLPTGLSINAATGLISGTIDEYASRTGPYTVTVTITDDKGAATTETFQWAVADVPPVATPALPDRSVSDGTSVTVTTASGFTNPNNVPYTYTATGLPTGLAIDPNTGVISGTIDHDASTGGSNGTYTIAVTANDGSGGTATNSFHLTSTNQAPVVATQTPNQENLDGDTITPIDTSKAFADPNGDPLTYSASALPAGLVIDPKTGIISGTVSPSAGAGAYSVAITATDDKGLKTTETFGWTIGSVPPQASGMIPNQAFADGSPGISITTSTAFSDRNNNPLTYSATGLPAGLSIDPATGKITGTLDHDASANAPVKNGSGASLDGTYTIVVTAADGIGGTAQQTFTIDATNQAPVKATNTPTQTNTDGDVVSVNTGEAFADPNTGDIVTYTAANLPAGLTIDPKTGVIAGTLSNTDYTASPYTIAVTATDDKGAATTESFTWVVKQADPMVYSPLPNVASFDGQAISIETAGHYSTDGTTVFTASGLPKGLTIDATTGVISGTIDHDASTAGPNPTGSGRTADSVYAVTVTVTNTSNPAGTTQTFALDVANQAPVVGTVTPNQSHMDGQTIQTVDASQAFSDPNGDTLTYSANNLPPGLTIDPSTGKITGTVAGNAYPGSYKVTVTATDDKGAATSEVFAWTVTDVPPTASGTLAGQTAPDGSSGISIATAGGFADANNNPLYYGATGLPPGLTIDPRTGIISGTIGHDASTNGPYQITVTAYDGLGGSAVQTFDFTATNNAPVVAAQTPDQHGQDGQSVSLATAPAFADPNGDPLTYAATNLPTGLSIDPTTGAITGTIDKSASKAGSYTVTVTATDDKGAATQESFTWTVDNLAPTATPPLADRSVNDGTGVSYATAGGFTNPNGLALTYSATGLPKGLVIDSATGLISGTLDHDASAAVSGGAYTIAVTVSDGQGGTATNTFHLVASNQAPVVTAPIADRTNQDGDTVTPIDASKVFADPNPGDIVTYSASNLPKGLTIDPASGLISGTVAADAAPGAYYVTVTATDDKGAATPATFTWGIGDVPPTAQGTLPAQHVSDSQIGISIPTASGFESPNGLPLTFSATGLPKGLTIDPSTGIISGFINHDASKNAPVTSGSGATLDGTYTVVVTVSDGQGGTAQQSFALDSRNQAPALGMPTADQHSADGQAVSVPAGQAFADPNTGDVITYTASGLPKGLTIDPATGTITGTIDPQASASAPYTVVVIATDDKGAATSETFHWAVDDVPPTAGTPIAPVSAADGQPIAPIDTASSFSSPNGLPLTYMASGLPAGLAIDPATGRISGTLDHDASKNAPVTSGSGATLDGTYTVVVTASDGQGGTAQQSFTFDATNQAPAITKATPDQHSADGQAVSIATGQAFADPNTGDVLTYTASGLPKGLTIDPATGTISGTIDPHASAPAPYTVVVTATDDKGAAMQETFHWAVDDVPPTAGTPIAPATAADGQPIAPIDTASSFSDPNGLPLTYTATGLPAGLAIDPATGRISGTLDHDASRTGPYTVVVTASDGQGGSAQQSFTLDATNQPPALTNPTPDQHSADGQTVVAAAGQAFADPNAGDVVTYGASGLPAGLTIDPASGTISGTIAGDARPGVYKVTVTATDDKGASASETFNWTVDDVPPTTATRLPDQHYLDGQQGVALATADGFASPNGQALSYEASGLPKGLSIDPATGRITGSLDPNASAMAPVKMGSGGTLEGVYVVTVTASDANGGSTSQVFAITVDNVGPTLARQTPDQYARPGDTPAPLDVGGAFSDATGDTLTYAAKGLPPGLLLDPATGLISGTLDRSSASSGAYTVTITATDGKGASASETFVYEVEAVPPNILRQPSAAIPLAALQPNPGTYDLFAAHGLDVQPATPVLDAIDKISGTTEGSQVIKEDGIVVSTVNGIAPLDGLQNLSRADGIVRSGAGTNERGDLIEKTQDGIGRGIEALSTPSTFFGATSIDIDAMARRDGTPGFNIETTLHDRVLAIGIGSIAGDGDPLVRVTVTRVDGSPLPPWLHVEGKGYVVGKVPGGIDRIDLRITTTFASGAHSERAVTIRTDRGTILPLEPRPHAARTLATMVAAAGRREATFAGIGDLI